MKEIPLTKGQKAIVDDEDYPRLTRFKWYANIDPWTGKYYAKRYCKERRKIIRMQEDIFGRKEGFRIDHINLETLDNRKSNLRHATKSQNLFNKQLYRNNKSGFKGVARNGNGFTARVMVNGRKRSVGTFKTLIEAAIAYNRGATQHYGEFARLNSIESRG